MPFKIIKSELVTFKITPDFEVTNEDNIVISNLISSLYRSPLKRLDIDLMKFKFTYKRKQNIFFDILLEPKSASFYITVPEDLEEVFLTQMESIWKGSAIEKVDSFNLNNFKYEDTDIGNLILKNYNFKSLSTSTNDLYPLTNMLGVTRQLQDDEKVRVNFNIDTIKRRNWIEKANDEYKRFKKGLTIDRCKTLSDSLIESAFKSFMFLIEVYIQFKVMIFESIVGIIIPNKTEEEEKEFNIKIDNPFEENKRLSDNTTYKMTSESFNVDINILSQSKDIDRRYNNMHAVASSYKDLSGDNELVLVKAPRKLQKRTFDNVVNFKSSVIKRKTMIFSDKEVAKFIQLPQRTLQQEYNLDNIDTRELEVHKDLLDEGIEIGTATYKKKEVKAYWCNDYNSMAMPKVVGGPMGAGKSKLTENFIVDANKLGHSTITFDYIKNCELTQNASKYTKNNVLIDLSNIEEMPSFCYPELSKLLEKADNFKKMEIASDVGQQIKYLINSVTDESTGQLTRPMTRFLIAAAKVVFIHPNQSLNDCIRVLEDWKTRNEYIRNAREVYGKENRVFDTLNELHKRDNEGKIVGTNIYLIEGILNRIDVLEESPRLQLMLQAKADNHDFEQYMNEGKAVYIMMPQKDFKDPQTVDVIVTYFMTRIRLASIERSEIDKPNICHIITDEVGQVLTASSFFKNHITEFRKFGIAPYFTMHYLKQFKSLLDGIKSAGTSYMLLAGLEKDNLMTLKEEMSPFTMEEAMKLKPYHSLNVIRHNNMYSRFITKLPKPI